MQVDTPYGDIFTVEQTVHPFTNQERMFNQKESNSTKYCVGGSCSGTQGAANEFIKETEKSVAELNKRMQETMKPRDDRPGKIHIESFVDMDTVPSYRTEHFISQDDRFMDPTSPDVVNNATPKDFTYNSYADWRAPTFNMWTRVHDDNCNEENRLRLGSKPMKYYVNQYNSPQVDPFQEYSIIGNQKAYGVRNEFERAIPTRLNPIYPTQVEPFPTTPFLGQANPSRMYADTSAALRWGSDLRNKPSEVALAEKDYNRWSPGVTPQTIQNAGQFSTVGGSLQQPGPEGYYDYKEQNNILFSNSSTPYFGIDTRNLLHNIVELSNC
jgi:hypothetical protein